MEKVYTPEQVAEILQIHPYTVLKYVKAGKIKGKKLGRVYRIKESSINDFLNSN